MAGNMPSANAVEAVPRVAVLPAEAPADGGSPSAQPEERRRYPRLERCSSVKVGLGPWFRRRWLKGRVINLSATGLAIELNTAETLAPGTMVRIYLDTPQPPPPLSTLGRSVQCPVKGTLMWSARESGTARMVVGIRLSRLIQEYLQLRGWAWLRAILMATAMVLLGSIVALRLYNVIWFWYEPWFHLYSLLVAGYLFSRTALALFYRAPQDRGFLPSVSLLIAVKNEEANIAQTVEHCFQSRYPMDRLEVIVVDDGSTDRTWAVLTELLGRFPNLRAFRFPVNRGKRDAMALGAQQACGEILIYIDSDSFVEPEGVYRIVQGFADPGIGAVAGHVLVIVEPTNVISKMESVRYFVSHRLMKAAESVFGCVTCCSGAFSAYRRSAVMAILPRWLNQTFLGTRSTFGDDRSLTNFVLRRYRVVFCETARAWTYVPSAWGKYFRQQLRWKKSWSRETLIASCILSGKSPIAALSYYVGILFTLVAPLMVLRNILVLPLFFSTNCLPYLTGLLIVYLFFCCVYAYFTRSACWYYGLMFAGLYIGVLSWQNYYAIATVSRTHWGTR